MYAVKNGHIDVTKVLLRQDSIDLLTTNKVSKELKQLIYRPKFLSWFTERPYSTAYWRLQQSTAVSQRDSRQTCRVQCTSTGAGG